MADREKVIKGLEMCLATIDEAECPEECPYYETCRNYENRVIFQPVMRDTLELLKEQEPKLVRYTASTVRCPNCNKQITTKGCIHGEIKYCWKCGQAVKW